MHPDLRRDLLTLLERPALARLLEALHASQVRHGEPKGRLKVGTRAESEALEDLIGKYVKPGGTIAVKEVDRLLLENTIFHCSVREVVEIYRGQPIVRPKEEKARFAAARDRAVRRCFDLLPGLGLSPEAYARVVGWMHAAEKDLRAGFRRWGEDGLLRAVRAVALAFDRMPDRSSPPVYLAELANEVTGSAHGLDTGRPAGTLLLRALEHHYPETARRERRGSAAWKTNLLSEARIARDPVSVRVDTFGLMGETPYLRELRRAALTRSVNLDDLAQIGADVRCFRGCAFVAENPTVFTALFKHVRERYLVDLHPTLICTNGTLNLADWTLLDALVGSGAHLFYCGDFDAKGLEIAVALLARYADAVSPWRMTADDYLAAIRADEQKLDPASLQRAERFFPALVREMGARRQAADQESLIATLKADLNRFVLEGITPPRRGGPPGGQAVEAASR